MKAKLIAEFLAEDELNFLNALLQKEKKTQKWIRAVQFMSNRAPEFEIS